MQITITTPLGIIKSSPDLMSGSSKEEAQDFFVECLKNNLAISISDEYGRLVLIPDKVMLKSIIAIG